MLILKNFLTSCLILLFSGISLIAQTNIKYGNDYVVIEAEDTNLNSNWAVRTPSVSGYLEYDFHTNYSVSPQPTNDTYLEYIGPWLGAGTDIEYKFTCPKTGSYQLAMRMLCPLRESNNPNKFVLKVDPRDGIEKQWEKADLRNDFFVKFGGNFTSGTNGLTTADLEVYHKIFGRGANKWGTCLNLEIHGAGNKPAIYNLIEGEEYTFYLKGRSTTTHVDYIVFYDTSYLAHDIFNQSTDLPLLLPEALRPYETLTGLEVVPNTAVVRDGKSTTLQVHTTPVNANPSVTWSSADTGKMTVDANGLVTAVGGSIGDKVVITATSIVDNSVMATREVEIVSDFSIPVTSVNIVESDLGIIEGQSSTLTTEVGPVDADNKTVIWSVGNASIASVDQAGQVTGVGSGTTTIRATSSDNSAVFDEITVNVVPLIQPSVAFDDRQKYIDGEYGNAGTMEVSVDYNAGSLNTVTSMTLFLRHMNSSWKVQNDIKIDITPADLPDVNSGTYTHNIPVDGITPAANLPVGDFYFLFIKMTSSNGESKNQGANPIKIIQADLSVDAFDFETETSVYPNPAVNGIVNVQSKADLFGKTGVLYNLSGIPVSKINLENDVNTIDVSSLATGIYLLQINDGDKVIASKQIIVK